MDDLRALIRSHRPNNAAAYYLQGNAGRFPKTGGWTLDPFVSPVCPAGSYTLAFLASEAHNVPLPPAMQGMSHPVIQVPEMSETALVKSKDRGVVVKEDPLLNHPDAIKNRVDFELTTFADASIRQKLLLTEQGQSFAYAHFWRQEAQQAIQAMSVLQQRERERLLTESAKQGAALAEAQAAKPPAPPDHFGSGLAFMSQLLSLLAPSRKDGESVLDALIANDSVESSHKTALLATKAELERAKAALAEKQEQARVAEQAKLAEKQEQAKVAEQAKLAEKQEQARVAEQAKLAESAEQARVAEQAKLAESAEQARLAELAKTKRSRRASRAATEERIAALETELAELRSKQARSVNKKMVPAQKAQTHATVKQKTARKRQTTKAKG